MSEATVPSPDQQPNPPNKKPSRLRQWLGLGAAGAIVAGGSLAANARDGEEQKVNTTPAAVAEPFAPEAADTPEVTPSEQQLSGPAPEVESPAGDPEVTDEDEQPTVTNPVPPPPPVVVGEGDGDPTVIDEDEQPVINNPQPPPGDGEEIPKTG